MADQLVAPQIPAPTRAPDATRAEPRSPWADAWRQFRRHRLAVAGLCVLAALGVAVTVGRR